MKIVRGSVSQGRAGACSRVTGVMRRREQVRPAISTFRSSRVAAFIKACCNSGIPPEIRARNGRGGSPERRINGVRPVCDIMRGRK